MLPDPLHPAVVHFPIVLVILLPLFVVGALWAVRRDVTPWKAWALPLAVAGGLFVSSAVALKTGQAEEDKVEAVVGDAALEHHEEAAERFLVLSGVVLLVAAIGLARGAVGTSARLLTAVGSLGLVAAGVQVGAAGGELVYRHNAASAYVGVQPGAPVPERESGEAR